jgi:hypothetical protein
LTGAFVSCGNGADVRVEQTPFRWVEGVWETETVATGPSLGDTAPTRVILRVSPDTLRRWKELSINPFVEACAQLGEHLRQSSRHGHLTALTLL